MDGSFDSRPGRDSWRYDSLDAAEDRIAATYGGHKYTGNKYDHPSMPGMRMHPFTGEPTYMTPNQIEALVHKEQSGRIDYNKYYGKQHGYEKGPFAPSNPQKSGGFLGGLLGGGILGGGSRGIWNSARPSSGGSSSRGRSLFGRHRSTTSKPKMGFHRSSTMKLFQVDDEVQAYSADGVDANGVDSGLAFDEGGVAADDAAAVDGDGGLDFSAFGGDLALAFPEPDASHLL
eukprot:tig00021759_g23418.t1